MIADALFSRYYLDEGIRQGEAWQSVAEPDVAAFAASLRGIASDYGDDDPAASEPSDALLAARAFVAYCRSLL